MAKPDHTHWPEAQKLGVNLQTGARTAEIDTDGQGRARAVVWIDRQGARHRARGDIVILCANAVGTDSVVH